MSVQSVYCNGSFGTHNCIKETRAIYEYSAYMYNVNLVIENNLNSHSSLGIDNWLITEYDEYVCTNSVHVVLDTT